MRILAVDVGTGTQDILLFDSSREVENCLKLVMPSPTVLVAERIKQATARQQAIVLTGTIMGGGPSQWATEAHARAGLKVYATPSAALSFNDELSEVEKFGVVIVSDDDAQRLQRDEGCVSIVMRDFHLEQIERAFEAFGVVLNVDAYAVAVFDHGNSPPGYSDRRFRFDFIANTVKPHELADRATYRSLASFAFMRAAIPPRLTRMIATANSIETDLPLLMMDTAPAAVLGALEDLRARAMARALVANIGNFHTLAFHIGDGKINGVFEHHTGELTQVELETYLGKLARGEITNEEVFNDMGHGALVFDEDAPAPTDLVVIGPRRGVLRDSSLKPYFAVPHGDMMIAGCFGLIRAMAAHKPEWREEIEQALGR
jgi:uncharacterized protein (DUF1786 family)